MQNPLTDLENLKKFLKSDNLWAKKTLGQNFLINQDVLDKIITAADLKKDDNIIEIGPGLGTLTFELAKRVAHITAIEKDSQIIPLLKKTIKSFENITILNEDALQFDPKKIFKENNNQDGNSYGGFMNPPYEPISKFPSLSYKIVANIPYYITSPLINHYLKDPFLNKFQNGSYERFMNPTYEYPPTSLVLLTQKEVAEKICSKQGKLNVLALNIQTFGKPEIIDFVSKNDFYPEPKVTSAILKITTYEKPLVNCDLSTYFKLIHAGFSQKRKKIHNTLTHSLHIKNEEIKTLLKKTEIDPNRRAETLKIEEWENLTREYTNLYHPNIL